VTATPSSLLSRLWGVALSALGIAVALTWAVSLIQSIWPWLVGMTVAGIAIFVAGLVLRRWWERGRW